jgi:hypothetical protein
MKADIWRTPQFSTHFPVIMHDVDIPMMNEKAKRIFPLVLAKRKAEQLALWNSMKAQKKPLK